MYVQSDLKNVGLHFPSQQLKQFFLPWLRPLCGSLAPKNMSVHFSAKTLYVFIGCRQKRSYGTIWIGLNMLTSYQSISLLLPPIPLASWRLCTFQRYVHKHNFESHFLGLIFFSQLKYIIKVQFITWKLLDLHTSLNQWLPFQSNHNFL